MDTTLITEAVKAVRNSEIALVFVGSSSTAFVRHSNEPSTSGEGIDLSDISLTGAQEQLIRSVCATRYIGSMVCWRTGWKLHC